MPHCLTRELDITLSIPPRGSRQENPWMFVPLPLAMLVLLLLTRCAWWRDGALTPPPGKAGSSDRV